MVMGRGLGGAWRKWAGCHCHRHNTQNCSNPGTHLKYDRLWCHVRRFFLLFCTRSLRVRVDKGGRTCTARHTRSLSTSLMARSKVRGLHSCSKRGWVGG